MPRRSLAAVPLALGLLVLGAGLTLALRRSPRELVPEPVLLEATFPARGLVTNEFAYWNRRDPRSHRSQIWQMGSGSLFARAGAGWSGGTDGCAPDAASSACTDSAVFRLTTRRADFGNVRVTFQLRLLRLGTTARTPAVAWDGVHIWLRYRSERELYYASVARRDGRLLIKKKCPGGAANGGTYYPLAERRGFRAPLGRWRDVGADAADLRDGSVRLRLLLDGKVRLSAVDRGIGCPVLTRGGRVGIRGDNADFLFRDFTVRQLR